MHLQSISTVKNQMSLTGDRTALMIMGNLILLTVGQNWPGRWKIQPYWQGWVPMDLFTREARMKCTCPWLSWDPQCTMASILLLAAQSLLNTFSHNDLLHVVAVISLLLQMSTNLYPKRAVDTFPLDLFYCLLFFSGALCTNPCRSEWFGN